MSGSDTYGDETFKNFQDILKELRKRCRPANDELQELPEDSEQRPELSERLAQISQEILTTKHERDEYVRLRRSTGHREQE